MIFQGAKFCSHCGAKVERTELAAATNEFCPRCKVELQSVLIGRTHLDECPKCEGLWADADSLRQICTDTEQQAAVLGMPASQEAQSVGIEEHIHYIPCPVCKGLMNRVNFAHCSNVIVNVCGRHGTWFDKDELRRVVEFIRGGGIEKERQQQVEDLREQQIRTASVTAGGAWSIGDAPDGWTRDLQHAGILAVASIFERYLRK
jgi:Zn-finger nucleic acid-binding protein